jgi:hypothetical protein
MADQIIEQIVTRTDWTPIYIALASAIISATGVLYAVIRGVKAEKVEREAREAADKKEREAREAADETEREHRKLTREIMERQNNLEFTKLLESFHNDLKLVLNRQSTLQTKEDHLRFIKDYLHILNRIAYLKNLNKIEKDLILYFTWYFEYGLFLMKISDIAQKKLPPIENYYTNIKLWVRENNIVKDNFEINKKMIKALSLTKADLSKIYEN